MIYRNVFAAVHEYTGPVIRRIVIVRYCNNIMSKRLTLKSSHFFIYSLISKSTILMIFTKARATQYF